MRVRQGGHRSLGACIRQLVAFRQFAFGPGIPDFLASLIFRQVVHRRGPLVLRVQRHLRAVAQRHLQLFRPDAVLVLRVVPYLDDRRFRLFRLVGILHPESRSSGAHNVDGVAFRHVLLTHCVGNRRPAVFLRQPGKGIRPGIAVLADVRIFRGQHRLPHRLSVRQQFNGHRFRPDPVAVAVVVPQLGHPHLIPVGGVAVGNGSRDAGPAEYGGIRILRAFKCESRNIQIVVRFFHGIRSRGQGRDPQRFFHGQAQRTVLRRGFVCSQLVSAAVLLPYIPGGTIDFGGYDNLEYMLRQHVIRVDGFFVEHQSLGDFQFALDIGDGRFAVIGDRYGIRSRSKRQICRVGYFLHGIGHGIPLAVNRQLIPYRSPGHLLAVRIFRAVQHNDLSGRFAVGVQFQLYLCAFRRFGGVACRVDPLLLGADRRFVCIGEHQADRSRVRSGPRAGFAVLRASPCHFQRAVAGISHMDRHDLIRRVVYDALILPDNIRRRFLFRRRAAVGQRIGMGYAAVGREFLSFRVVGDRAVGNHFMDPVAEVLRSPPSGTAVRQVVQPEYQRAQRFRSVLSGRRRQDGLRTIRRSEWGAVHRRGFECKGLAVLEIAPGQFFLRRQRNGSFRLVKVAENRRFPVRAVGYRRFQTVRHRILAHFNRQLDFAGVVGYAVMFPYDIRILRLLRSGQQFVRAVGQRVAFAVFPRFSAAAERRRGIGNHFLQVIGILCRMVDRYAFADLHVGNRRHRAVFVTFYVHRDFDRLVFVVRHRLPAAVEQGEGISARPGACGAVHLFLNFHREPDQFRRIGVGERRLRLRRRLMVREGHDGAHRSVPVVLQDDVDRFLVQVVRNLVQPVGYDLPVIVPDNHRAFRFRIDGLPDGIHEFTLIRVGAVFVLQVVPFVGNGEFTRTVRLLVHNAALDRDRLLRGQRHAFVRRNREDVPVVSQPRASADGLPYGNDGFRVVRRKVVAERHQGLRVGRFPVHGHFRPDPGCAFVIAEGHDDGMPFGVVDDAVHLPLNILFRGQRKRFHFLRGHAGVALVGQIHFQPASGIFRHLEGQTGGRVISDSAVRNRFPEMVVPGLLVIAGVIWNGQLNRAVVLARVDCKYSGVDRRGFVRRIGDAFQPEFECLALSPLPAGQDLLRLQAHLRFRFVYIAEYRAIFRSDFLPDFVKPGIADLRAEYAVAQILHRQLRDIRRRIIGDAGNRCLRHGFGNPVVIRLSDVVFGKLDLAEQGAPVRSVRHRQILRGHRRILRIVRAESRSRFDVESFQPEREFAGLQLSAAQLFLRFNPRGTVGDIMVNRLHNNHRAVRAAVCRMHRRVGFIVFRRLQFLNQVMFPGQLVQLYNAVTRCLNDRRQPVAGSVLFDGIFRFLFQGGAERFVQFLQRFPVIQRLQLLQGVDRRKPVLPVQILQPCFCFHRCVHREHGAAHRPPDLIRLPDLQAPIVMHVHGHDGVGVVAGLVCKGMISGAGTVE